LIDKILFFCVNFIKHQWEKSFLIAACAEVSAWLLKVGIAVLIFLCVTLLASIARVNADTALTWIRIVSDQLLIVACSASDIACLLFSDKELEYDAAGYASLLISLNTIALYHSLIVWLCLSLACSTEHLTLNALVVLVGLIISIDNISIGRIAILTGSKTGGNSW
jgi:hypothetical protein